MRGEGAVGTGDDALWSKWEAARWGYVEDGFVEAMAAGGGDGGGSRKRCGEERRLRPDGRKSGADVWRRIHPDPIMHRGTYARITAIRRLCEWFLWGEIDAELHPLNVDGRCRPPRRRIVSFGAGLDTLPLVLLTANRQRSERREGAAQVEFIELDVAEVVADKARRIVSNAMLGDAIQCDTANGDEPSSPSSIALSTDGYKLIAADLRDTSSLRDAMAAAGVGGDARDQDVPTLFLLECVLVYLTPEVCEQLLRFLASLGLRRVAYVRYDPLGLRDAFGSQMVRNLEERGLPLRGLSAAPSVEHLVQQAQQVVRAASVSATVHATGLDMWEVYHALMQDTAERKRVESLEWLDEIEQFALLMRHYALVWATGEGVPRLFLTPVR
ncbi:hypothetical protein CDCA_CDCA03G0914 [Cyanidium caldarium]|uniref:Leucine carboxyl methyltransferase 1 n=1 Tax=Cyanidium caldarium TaxID=2771 RepID=A0AAV9IRW2_CYACA|nr:hypothetical protein CDCA_CDCA03G0914 [Cyanidium caldarium]